MNRTRARYNKQNLFQRHISEHKGIYILIIIIFIIGFIIGAMNSAFIDEETRAESTNYILNFVEYLKTQEIDNSILLKESLSANIKPAIYIMIFGLIFIGAPLIFVYIGLYSYSIGFTVTSILASLGNTKGTMFILTLMLPQELILLPTLFVMAVNAILLSKKMLQINNRNIDIKKELLKYIIIFTIGIVIIIGASLFETYIGSNIAKMSVNLLVMTLP